MSADPIDPTPAARFFELPKSRCPGCGEVKWVGHGPLCGPCFTGQPDDYEPDTARAPSASGALITPGGNPTCPRCRRWYGPGQTHACAPTDVRNATLAEAADLIESELICCDVFERLSAKGSENWTEEDQREMRLHAICYWSNAARHLALGLRDTDQTGGASDDV